jgi:hypothetical protein
MNPIIALLKQAEADFKAFIKPILIQILEDLGLYSPPAPPPAPPPPAATPTPPPSDGQPPSA